MFTLFCRTVENCYNSIGFSCYLKLNFGIRCKKSSCCLFNRLLLILYEILCRLQMSKRHLWKRFRNFGRKFRQMTWKVELCNNESGRESQKAWCHNVKLKCFIGIRAEWIYTSLIYSLPKFSICWMRRSNSDGNLKFWNGLPNRFSWSFVDSKLFWNLFWID